MFQDEKLWLGNGLSERVALWDKYAMSSVDEHKIKVDFLRKSMSRRYHPFSQRNLNQPHLTQVCTK